MPQTSCCCCAFQDVNCLHEPPLSTHTAYSRVSPILRLRSYSPFPLRVFKASSLYSLPYCFPCPMFSLSFFLYYTFVRRACQGFYTISTARVHSEVTFHSKFPLIALFRLMHFRITGFVCVFGGAGRADDGSVHNGAALHHMTGLHHDTVNCVKKQLVQTVCLQQMAEFAQCRFILPAPPLFC